MAKPLKSGRCWCGFALQSRSDAYRRDDDFVSPIGHQLLYALLRPPLTGGQLSLSCWLPAQEARLLSGVAATGRWHFILISHLSHAPLTLPRTSCASFPVAQDYLTPQASCGSGQERIRIILW